MENKVYGLMVFVILIFAFGLKAQKTIDDDSLVAGEWNDLLRWDFWTQTAMEDFLMAKSHWQWPDMERYTVQIVNKQQVPIPNCELLLVNHKKEILWQSKTDIDGQAEMWSSRLDAPSLAIIIKYAKNEWTLEQPLPYSQKINNFEIEAPCPKNNLTEIAFVVDATGSMKDEMHFLKKKMSQILEQAKKIQPKIKIRSGVVFYRDYEESFLVRKMDLTSDFSSLTKYIAQQPAAGGGDHTEAVEAALDSAIQRLSWSTEASSRIIFLWMDGPPKITDPITNQLHQSVKLASQKGIQIIPLMASGADTNTEFLLRNLALQTNGVFTFLNDISAINSNHLVPITDAYTTGPLADLLLKLISERSVLPHCKPVGIEMEDASISALERDDLLLQKIHCYPNPTSKQFNIELTSIVDRLRIQNATGQQLFELEQLEQGQKTINVDQWPAGIYFLNFQKENSFAIQKIIVTK